VRTDEEEGQNRENSQEKESGSEVKAEPLDGNSNHQEPPWLELWKWRRWTLIWSEISMVSTRERTSGWLGGQAVTWLRVVVKICKRNDSQRLSVCKALWTGVESLLWQVVVAWARHRGKSRHDGIGKGRCVDRWEKEETVESRKVLWIVKVGVEKKKIEPARCDEYSRMEDR